MRPDWTSQSGEPPIDGRSDLPVQTFHVLTVAPGLPLRVYDTLMTSAQQALEELGASRVWVDPARPLFAVMAELPFDADPDQA